MKWQKVVVIGLDGLDPLIVEAMMAARKLPHLDGMRQKGGYSRVATTMPALTPVAWSSFAVGANPGAHGIFDFLRRDPKTYVPEIGLYRHEQKSRFLPPRAVNLRGGKPVWEHLSHAGIPSTILRHPCTYPPNPFRGRVLAGVGVPDLRGGFGSSSFYSSDPRVTPGESEHVSRVEPDEAGRATVELRGPLLHGSDDLRLKLDLEVDAAAGTVQIRSLQEAVEALIEVGRWSPWVHVRFKHGVLQTVRGLVRFYLADVSPLSLFVSAIHFDPDLPLFPISHPWDYSAELRREIGPFATLGLPEEHNGLINGRIDEDAFLAQCLDLMHERRAMMHFELARHDRGLFFCLFDTPDRVQHMFWRFREAGHPANHGELPPPEMADVIEDYYRKCDDIVGEALAYASDDTLVVVLSDHDLLKQVDWGRTRAYALGMAGLYLNLAGREGEGIVSSVAAPPLADEIAARLVGFRDTDRGEVAVRAVLPRDRVYKGPFLNDAPDLLVGYARGYRVASATVMGHVGADLVKDNIRPWSGDHVVDPVSVPGILFMNAPFRGEGAHLIDLAPSILGALDAPPSEDMEGVSLIS